MLSAQKGTQEYNVIMDRLRRTNYAHQVDQNDDEEDDAPAAINADVDGDD